jgi:hypothetical protein
MSSTLARGASPAADTGNVGDAGKASWQNYMKTIR